MTKDTRQQALLALERLRGSRVVSYVVGDRLNLSGEVESGVVPAMLRHLQAGAPHQKVDLFLYSRGGEITVPLRLIDLVREYTPRVACLVPFRAYSAATLICLGANEIVMGPLGELGPVDPTTSDEFSRQKPGGRIGRLRVEDVTSYFELAKKTAGLAPEQSLEVFRDLTRAVHPLTLGNVERVHRLIHRLAQRLLAMHMDEKQERERIDSIVQCLTEKLYSHSYPISRREAAEFGLPVTRPEPEVEAAMWRAYKEYEADGHFTEPFDLSSIYRPDAATKGAASTFAEQVAFVESVVGSDAYVVGGRRAVLGQDRRGKCCGVLAAPCPGHGQTRRRPVTWILRV